MSHSAPQVESERRIFATPGLILLIGLISQILIGIALWNHHSDDGVIFGGYSPRYALVLLANIVATLLWLAAFLARKRILPKLNHLNNTIRYGLIGLVGIGLFVIWLMPIEEQIKQFATLNSFFLGLLLVSTAADSGPQAHSRQIFIIVAVVAFILLIPMLVTVLTTMPFSPDEAHWADYATTPFMNENGGLYARTWLMEPQTITPGIGWSVAAYGWFLENAAFDIRIGRLWNFLSYCLAYIGIAVLTYRLYGGKAALISTIFAILSAAFIPIFDYRPDHQIAAATVWIVVCAVIGRQTPNPHVRGLFHFLCGLLAALAMQLHAIAIVLISGIGLFYALEAGYTLYKTRTFNIAVFVPLITYIAATAVGGGIFYVFNIAPVGGLTAYLNGIGSRTQRLHSFPFFLTWVSLFEAIVIGLSFTFLLWRRNKADKLFMSITSCILIVLLILDTQGYRSPVIGLYAVPVGAFFAAGFSSANGKQVGLAFAVLAMVMVASTASFINWLSLSALWNPDTASPYLYEALKDDLQPYVRDDDTIVSTHLLIWTLGNRPDFYSVAGEFTGAQRWEILPEAVWERLQPTLIIDIPGEMDIGEGLSQYMTQHDFQACQSLVVQNKTVNLYRTHCT